MWLEGSFQRATSQMVVGIHLGITVLYVGSGKEVWDTSVLYGDVLA